MQVDRLLVGPRAPGMARLYLPPVLEIPRGDLTALVFDFPAVAGFATAEGSQVIQRPMLITHAVAYSQRAAGFRAQLYHTHGQVQHLLFAKPQLSVNVFGTAKLPVIYRSPYFIEAGDSFSVEVKNLDNGAAPNNTNDVQIVFWGVHPQGL